MSSYFRLAIKKQKNYEAPTEKKLERNIRQKYRNYHAEIIIKSIVRRFCRTSECKKYQYHIGLCTSHDYDGTPVHNEKCMISLLFYIRFKADLCIFSGIPKRLAAALGIRITRNSSFLWGGSSFSWDMYNV